MSAQIGRAGGAPVVGRAGMDGSVAAIVRREPVTVSPYDSIAAALVRMARNQIGSIVVTRPENHVPVGILTLQDVLCRIAIPGVDTARPVSSVMSGDLVSVTAEVTVRKAALLMARNKLRHLLVTDAQGALLGIVSKNDIYDVMCDTCAATRNARRQESRIAEAPRPVDAA